MLDDAPDQRQIHTEVVVRQAIAHAGYLLRWDLRPTFLRSVGELLDGLDALVLHSRRDSARMRSRSAGCRLAPVNTSTPALEQFIEFLANFARDCLRQATLRWMTNRAWLPLNLVRTHPAADGDSNIRSTADIYAAVRFREVGGISRSAGT